MSEPYSLCVVFKIKPEHAEEFAILAQQSVTETRKDKGVLAFNYHKVLGETTWLLYEIWESKADSDAHREKPDVQAFFARAPQLLAAEPVIYPLGPVL